MQMLQGFTKVLVSLLTSHNFHIKNTSEQRRY